MPEPIPHWEWWVVLYFFFGGIAGGAYFLASMVDLIGREEDRPIARMGYLMAFPLAILCAVLLIVDLGRPERFWHMIVYSKTFLPWPKWDSPISVGSYVLLLFGLFTFVSFLNTLSEMGKLRLPVRLAPKSAPRMILAVLGAVTGLFLASYTGVLLAHTHFPAWANTPLLGALFVTSGVSTGAAAIALGLALTGAKLNEGWNRLKLADNIAIIVEIVFLVLLLVLLGTAAAMLLRPVPAMLLLVGAVLLGLLVPLALQFRSGFGGIKSSQGTTMLAAALILIGGFILRMVIVLAPQGII